MFRVDPLDGRAEPVASTGVEERHDRIEVGIVAPHHATRLEGEDDLGSQVVDPVPGRVDRVVDRQADRLVARGDPRLAVVWRHREVGQPWAAAVAADPELAAILEQVVGLLEWAQRAARIGPDAQVRRQLIEDGRQVRLEEPDVDVLVVPRPTGEGVDRPAADDPPAGRHAREEVGDLRRRQRSPRAIPAVELAVLLVHIATSSHPA